MIKKSIHNQTQDYLQRNGLLYIDQSGFRSNHSTDTNFSRLKDMILNDFKLKVKVEMVSFLPYKQGSFRFIAKYLFGSRDHKLQSSSRIYVRIFIVFPAYK